MKSTSAEIGSEWSTLVGQMSQTRGPWVIGHQDTEKELIIDFIKVLSIPFTFFI